MGIYECRHHSTVLIMSGLLSHSKNSMPVWFRLFWRVEELHALSYALLPKPKLTTTLNLMNFII